MIRNPLGTDETNEFLCHGDSYCEENVESGEEDYGSNNIVRTSRKFQITLVGDQQDFVRNPETPSGVHTESRDEFYQSVPSSKNQHQIGRFSRAESLK